MSPIVRTGPSRKNIEWTGAILSFFFLMIVYILSGKHSNALSDSTSQLTEKTPTNQISGEVYRDDEVKVLYFRNKTISDVMQGEDNATPINRIYSEMSGGIAVIEGNENSQNAKLVLRTLRQAD